HAGITAVRENENASFWDCRAESTGNSWRWLTSIREVRADAGKCSLGHSRLGRSFVRKFCVSNNCQGLHLLFELGSSAKGPQKWAQLGNAAEIVEFDFLDAQMGGENLKEKIGSPALNQQLLRLRDWRTRIFYLIHQRTSSSVAREVSNISRS